jgi:hypothetical protein
MDKSDRRHVTFLMWEKVKGLVMGLQRDGGLISPFVAFNMGHDVRCILDLCEPDERDEVRRMFMSGLAGKG